MGNGLRLPFETRLRFKMNLRRAKLPYSDEDGFLSEKQIKTNFKPVLDCRAQRIVVVVFVVSTFNRLFYPATLAVPPVTFLILHIREIKIL